MYTYTNKHTYIHTYVRTCIHACIHTYIHTRSQPAPPVTSAGIPAPQILKACCHLFIIFLKKEKRRKRGASLPMAPAGDHANEF